MKLNTGPTYLVPFKKSSTIPVPQPAGIFAVITVVVAVKTIQLFAFTFTWIFVRSDIKFVPVIVITVFFGPDVVPVGEVTLAIVAAGAGIGLSLLLHETKRVNIVKNIIAEDKKKELSRKNEMPKAIINKNNKTRLSKYKIKLFIKEGL